MHFDRSNNAVWITLLLLSNQITPPNKFREHWISWFVCYNQQHNEGLGFIQIDTNFTLGALITNVDWGFIVNVFQWNTARRNIRKGVKEVWLQSEFPNVEHLNLVQNSCWKIDKQITTIITTAIL